MYKADEIELNRTQYLELRHVERYGGEGRDYTPYVGDLATFTALNKLGLANFMQDGRGNVVGAWLLDDGRDWITSYESSNREKLRLERRDWVMLAVSAVISGMVSFAVSLAANSIIG